MIVEIEDSGYATSPLLSGTVCLSLPSCRGRYSKLVCEVAIEWNEEIVVPQSSDRLPPEQVLSGNLNPNERFLVDYLPWLLKFASVSGLGIRSINIRIYILHRWRLWEYDILCRHRLVSVDERHGQPSQYLILVAIQSIAFSVWTSLNLNTWRLETR